jgi:hypothetical protein
MEGMGMRSQFSGSAFRWGAAAGLLLGLSAIVAAILVVRLAGAEPAGPLSAGWPFAVMLVLGGMCAAGNYALLRAGGGDSLPVRVLAALMSGGIITTAVLATASHGSTATFAGGCVASLLCLAGLVWLALCGVDLTVKGDRSQDSEPASPLQSRDSLEPARQEIAISTPDHHEPVDQTWRRWKHAGQDILEGCVRVQFQPGQSTATIHVPVQPAMSSAPEVECEPTDDADIRTSADPVLPYGVRFTCRRTRDVQEPMETAISIRLAAPAAIAKAA